MTKPLSPSAIAVWEAFNQDKPGVFVDYGDCLAAAIQALVDQAVPADPCGDDCCIDLSVGIRANILAIAAELGSW